MTPSKDWFNQIEGLLTRLSCDSVVEPSSVDRVREQLLTVATMFDESGNDEGVALAAEIRGAVTLMTPSDAGVVVEDLLTRWERVKAVWSAPAAPAAPGAPAVAPAATTGGLDEELAVLASDPEMSGMFVAEALDHLGTIESVLLQLEGKPGDAKLLNDVFRPFHTIKGNAGALGVTSVQELAHIVENLLDLARAGKHAMGIEEFEIVLKAVDLLTLMINELPARIAGQPGSDTKGRRDTLMTGVMHLIAHGSSAGKPSKPVEVTATTLAPAPGPVAAPPAPVPVAAASAAAGDDTFMQRRTDTSAGRQPGEAAPSATAIAAAMDADPGRSRRVEDTAVTVKVDTRKLDNLIDMVGELVIAQSILAEDPALSRSTDERLGRRLAQLKRITSDLQRNAMAMRMVPIRQTFQKMARLVRDLSKRSGKQIELVLQGEDTELDRRVVEDINDPLMHMVRNSVDHGIELADARAAAGKPAQATLRLSAFHQAGNIVIEIADDGQGLNTERILAKAIERGLVAEGTPLPPLEIHNLIFQPGFSTAEKITEISGRGVGMDVVRRNIEALRGQIEIQTARGKGTTFSIRLPLTLAIVDGIMLAVGVERFVVPTFAVRESLRPLPSQVHTLHGTPCMVQVRERLIPTLHIGELFSVQGARKEIAECTVVVIEDAGRPVALVVDELLGKQEVVIKSLGESFQNVRGVAGGAILGDGRIGLILDAGGLMGLMGRSPIRQAA
jgi:two-component system, chemotaxis family, sensor kinase CheA